MCIVDEETALLLKGSSSEGYSNDDCTKKLSLWSGLGRGMLFAFAGFVVGVCLMRKEELRHHRGENIKSPQVPSSRSKYVKYNKFQPLNFQLYTGGAPVETGNVSLGTNKANPECRDLQWRGSLAGQMQCYMGHENGSRDVSDRLAIMEEAVQRAYQLSDKSSDTLKIFVAPEFFFRGRNGAYVFPNETESLFKRDSNSGECHQEICEILRGLERLVAQRRFEDWLFFFGTVVAAETLPVEDRYDYLFYNFGILYRGYDPSKTTHVGKRFLVPKRYVSNLDFLTPYRSVDDGDKGNTLEIFESNNPYDQTVLNPHDLEHILYDRRMWYVYKDEIASLGYTMVEYGWLVVDGITMTVEICLDHAKRSALTAYLADASSINATLIPSARANDGRVDYVPIPSHQAQISLVSSASMTAMPESLVLADGGSIVLQDGISDGPVDMKWEIVCFLYDWSFNGGTEVVKRTVSMTPTEVLFQYEPNRDYQKHSIFTGASQNHDRKSETTWKDSLRGVFSTAMYEPMILVYQSQEIARVD